MDQPVGADPLELQKDLISETLFEQVLGIVKTQRAPMPELPVAERIQSFVEADQVLSEQAALGESSRCLNCCLTCYNPDKASGQIEVIKDVSRETEVA